MKAKLLISSLSLFMKVVTRKRFELKNDLEHIEIIYSKLMDLQNTE